MTKMGVLPMFRRVDVHDFWKSYFKGTKRDF